MRKPGRVNLVSKLRSMNLPAANLWAHEASIGTRRSLSSAGFAALLFLGLLCISPCTAQTEAPNVGQFEEDYLSTVLKDQVVSPAVAQFQVRRYILEHVASAPKPPANAQAWDKEAERLRRHLLGDVIFHGWPREWINAKPRFVETGIIEGQGYRIHKLRYEIVPGFEASALLYEPDRHGSPMPAILNLEGHLGPIGQAAEFKQKRCVQFAKHGILALSLEWFSYGELNKYGNGHQFGAHLNLAGSNMLGLFYLEMRRGLDYLYENSNVDRHRIGVTGLSGGGWQTIVLSALDPRVKAANPVAGFSSERSRVEVKEYGDWGDLEQSAPDFLRGFDYPYLAAMMAPRPTLLTYNAEDDCCFRATLVKPRVFDQIRPFFELYGKQDIFTWHENYDPGTHNYQLDNRLADYRFFSKTFGLAPIDGEDGVAAEIRSYDELKAGLPENNLTILSLAQKLAAGVKRDAIPSRTAEKAAWGRSQRSQLREVVRYKPVQVDDYWAAATTKRMGIQSISYQFELNNGLSASGIWMRSIRQSSATAPVTIVLNDRGKQESTAAAANRLVRGDQVLALDLLFTDASWRSRGELPPYVLTQAVDALGDRSIGIEAAQLVAVTRWAAQQAKVSQVRLETDGIRTQGIALVAAALEPDLFSSVVVQNGVRSLEYLFQRPVNYEQAPELFCLDLFKYFDIHRLEAIASPTRIAGSSYLELPESQPSR